MTTTPSDDFAAWLGAQLQPEAPAAEEQPPAEAAPTSPKPDPSQGGADVTIAPSAASTFAYLLHDNL